MYFKRLEMHGFKSFAEPVVIEFHEGVTCIVGPNGSGKSNISDAIRWVLGEQSPKALRGGKMEEVIFAGTADRKSRGMAEVTLVIDNSTGILDIDYNEVAITRRMYRSGESEYLINNNQCRLRDIRELIMDTGIGVDGYSLIGQGKISDIVSNKPESRREIFEEAAGVVMYKSKKAEAERKLGSTSNNLERVSDIIAEIEGRIDGLREDSTKAKEYLELKERYRDLEINITLKNIENINQRNEAFKNDIAELEKEITSITASKKRVDEEVAAAREKNENLERLGNEARDKLLEIVEKINTLTNQNQLNEERLSSIEKDSSRLQAEAQTLRDKLDKETLNKEELKKTKSEILSKHTAASEELQEKIHQHSEITKQASETAEAIDSGREKLFQLHNQISSKNSEVKSYESIKETLTKRKAQLAEDSAGAEKNSADNEKMLSSSEEEQKQLLSDLQDLTEQLSALDKEQKDLSDQQKELRLTLEDLKLQGGQKTSRKKTIEEMENNYEGYNYAVKYIMRSGIPGIEGVVAELMEVPSGFEAAIETALGGQMQNIICDSDQNAKLAVNALKENRAGRLTFLPVSSVKGSSVKVDSQISADRGYRGLAVDCVSFDSRYRSIFTYLLGRVAVVDNMDTAIKLSKMAGTGIRFVTLDGEIINASGAITGGKYKNKTANLLERKSEISKLEEEIEDLRRQVSAASVQSKDAAARLEEIRDAKLTLEAGKRQKEIALAALDSTISALRDTLNDIQFSSRKYDRELLSIDKEMADADNMIAAFKKDILNAEQAIEKTNAALEEAMNGYEIMKETVDCASEEITKTRIAVNDWESKKANVENLLSRIEEAADDYQFQIEEKKRQLCRLDEEKNQILFGSGDSEKDTKQLMEEKKSTESYIEEVTSERGKLNERISVITKEQETAGANLNSYQDQKYQLEIKLAKNETQLDTHKERLWEDFEISYAQALDLKKEDFIMSASVKESRDIRNRIRELGEVNVGSIKEYESVSERYRFLTEQRDDILTAMEELKTIISDMDATIKTKFKENFDQIVENFEVIFHELFGGGHAELRMEDENNPLESGIDIIAQPPGKKLQNINLMSGGEKTMTAIALMFAVLKTKPTPFCILDEVEAALDDANIDRFANYLRKFDGIQFALVTHQKATMEHADVLYGVTMAERGVSKVLSLRLGDDFDL